MFLGVFTSLIALGASVVAQPSPAVICVAGQCLAGFSNTTIGAKISASGITNSALLLPGQYTSSTNPQLLHSLLTSSSAILSPSPGFQNSTPVTLPLNVAMQPGLAVFPQSLYAGQSAFAQLPSTPPPNASQPLSAGSIALSSNIWAAVNAGSNNRVILWDSIPDVAQLPSTSSGSLSLLDIESSACSPPCASSGVCSASGTCSCAPGFTGNACESCASGFFGPTCQPCPAGCSSCDDGLSGSGRCLTATVSAPPSSCNCLNGVCGSNGQCTCNPGFTTANNGTACAKCSPGFFLTSTGDCKVCSLGCTNCADGDGTCISCNSGFTQSANDRTQCLPVPSVTSSGTVCPDGSFSNGVACTPCSPLCQTCSGATSNDCIICGSGRYSSSGNCVPTDNNGVCAGSKLIADNNKHECDTCGAKCTSCIIPNFNVASTVNQLQCTGCLPGFVLSKGQCVQNCPTGTFLSPQDNLTCTPCNGSCGSCVGSSDFCLTCTNGQLASSGKCVASCPSNTFASSSACVPCHPDCASCSGTAFNQCSSCNSNRPVLTGGRCLPTCSKAQFFDKTTSTCQTCDASCSSCSGSGPGNCLACSNPNQVLRQGSCVTATCASSSNVVPGLGVCLSDLVQVPSSTNAGTPLPSITGLTTPITVVRRPLEWWEILLMALGCAFIFVGVLFCWRRHARKKRAKQTAAFAYVKSLDSPRTWRGRLARFGERLFGHGPSATDSEENEGIKLMKLRNAEEARHHMEMEKLMGSSYSVGKRKPPPSLYDGRRESLAVQSESSRLSEGSLYSQITGLPRKTPEPRMPVKRNADLLLSRFSSTDTTLSRNSSTSRTRELTHRPASASATEVEPYSQAVRGLEPSTTGRSRNPFLKRTADSTIRFHAGPLLQFSPVVPYHTK